MNEILKHLSDHELVLDLGSSAGSFNTALTRARIIRVDLHFDCDMGSGIRIRANASHLPFRGKAFDAIVSSHSLEHFEELDGALLEIGRVIKENGALFIAVPDGCTLTDKVYRSLARGGGHVNMFTSSAKLIDLVQSGTGLQFVAMRTLFTSLAFLNRHNKIHPGPIRLRLSLCDREPILVVINYMLRQCDRLLGTRTAIYGWSLYFGILQESVDINPWTNVCVRCANAHASEWLKLMRVVRKWCGLIPIYRCPICGAANPFFNDCDFSQK